MRILLAFVFVSTLAYAQAPVGPNPEPGAVAEARAAVAQHPKQSSAHESLGLALAAHGDLKAAIEEFAIALPHADAKERPRVLLALGTAYFQLQDFAAAKGPLQAVLEKQTRKMQPEQVQALTLLAQCDLKLNDAEGALAVMIPHASLAEQDMAFGRTLGLALVRTGKRHDGAQMLHRVAELTNDADLYLVAGEASFENAEYDQARRDLETATHLNPQVQGVMTLLGMARFASADRFAAEASLRDAVRMEPSAYLPEFYLGVVRLQQGDETRARECFAKSRIAASQAPPALTEAEIVPSAAAQLEPAIQELRRLADDRANAGEGRAAEAHVQLAAVYARLGRTSEAAAEQQLAAEVRF